MSKTAPTIDTVKGLVLVAITTACRDHHGRGLPTLNRAAEVTEEPGGFRLAFGDDTMGRTVWHARAAHLERDVEDFADAVEQLWRSYHQTR